MRLKMSPRLGGQVVTSICMVITGNQDVHTVTASLPSRLWWGRGQFGHLVDAGSTEEGGNTSTALLGAVTRPCWA